MLNMETAKLGLLMITIIWSCVWLHPCNGQGFAAAPINVRASKILNNPEIRVSWDKLTSGLTGSLVGYRVSYSESKPAGTERIKLVGASDITTVIGNLKVFTKYYVRVQGYTSVGNGNWSSPLVAVTTDEATPSAPPKTTVYRSETPTTIYLEWEPLPPEIANGIIRGYEIGYIEAKYFTNPLLVSQHLKRIKYRKTSPRKFTITSLDPYTEYLVGVAAFNSKRITIELSWLTAARRVTTLEDVPSGSPGNVNTQLNCQKYQLIVSWSALNKNLVNGRLLGYKVLVNSDTGESSRNFTVAANEIETGIPVDECINHTAKVAAFTSPGTGPYSGDVTTNSACQCGPPLVSDMTVLAVEKKPVTLPCSHRGRPPIIHANWTRGGHPLVPSKTDIKNQQKLGNFSWYISQAIKSDAGVYTCAMRNAFGAASVDVLLIVAPGFATVKFTITLVDEVFTKDLKDKYSVEHRKLKSKLRKAILTVFQSAKKYEVSLVEVLSLRNSSVTAEMAITVSLRNSKDESVVSNSVKDKLTVSTNGGSGFMGEMRVNGLQVHGIPVPPENLSATKIDKHKINLSWSPPRYHDVYSITNFTLKYRTLGNVSEFASSKTVPFSQRYGTIDQLDSNTMYEVVVVARNGFGESGESSTLRVKTLQSQVPYPGLNGIEILDKLREGYRLERPDGCSEKMYQIMLGCWEVDPNKRPDFEALVEKTERMLADLEGYLDVLPSKMEIQEPSRVFYEEKF